MASAISMTGPPLEQRSLVAPTRVVHVREANEVRSVPGRGYLFSSEIFLKVLSKPFQHLARFSRFSSHKLIPQVQTPLIIRVLASTGTRIMTG
jgi:hypothetical protein